MLFALIAIASAGIDLGSKAWALARLSAPTKRTPALCYIPPGAQHYLYQRRPTGHIDIVRGFFDLQYTENCGGAFGMLHAAKESFRRPFFAVVSAFAIGFVIYLYRGLDARQHLSRVALPLVLGGAIGNLVDRIHRGYVVDFFHAHWREAYAYPTFNVADIAIVVGMGLMLLEYLLGVRSDKLGTAGATQ